MIAMSTMGAQNPFHHFPGIQSLEEAEEGLHYKYNSACAHLEDHDKNSFGQGEQKIEKQDLKPWPFPVVANSS